MRARAWCRVDLGGGTLDIWPLGLLHPGAVTVNVAIDLGVSVELARSRSGYVVRQGDSEVRAESAETLSEDPEAALIGLIASQLRLPPVRISIESGSPRGGGLGASSALAVALISAGEALLEREESRPDERAALARDLEARLMSLPTGRQDHFPALLGGAVALEHCPGGERVRRLEVDLEALGKSLLVVYTGTSHFSAGTNWQIIRRRLEGDPETIDLFDGIAALAKELGRALEGGDLERVGRQVGEEWSLRRRLADGISTPRIEEILSAAGGAGAWGGKACGAGGGGCVAIVCPPHRRDAVATAAEEAGGEILAARPASGALLLERIRPHPPDSEG